MQNRDLTAGSAKKQFFQYLLPSISATMVTSIYVLADTIIIGKGLGADAMAALNIVLPLFNLFFGNGLLFGVGGAVLMSVARGTGNKDAGKQFYSVGALMNFIISVLFTVICFLFLKPLLYALGATEVTMPFIMDYVPYIIGGNIFFAFSTFLQTFVRNDGAPRLSMIAVITGGVLNIILDIVFVFPMKMGMSGAAIASVLGSVCTVGILLFHLRSPQNGLHFSLKGIRLRTALSVIKNGFTSFILEISSGITIFVFNLLILELMGETGVSTYGIITNTAIVVMCLGNGVSQAAQPLISVNYGAKLWNRVEEIRKAGNTVSFLLSAVVGLSGLIFPQLFINIFLDPDPAIMEIAPTAIRIYFTAFFLMGINMFAVSYFQSTLRAGASMLLSLSRGCVLCCVLAYVLPLIMGTDGIWLAMPIAEAITLILGILLLKKDNYKRKPIGER